MSKNKIYIDIIESTFKEMFDDNWFTVETNNDDTRLNIVSTIYNRCQIFTFFTEDSNFIINCPFLYNENDHSRFNLKEIKTNDIELFKKILSIVIEEKILPHLVSSFKEGRINKLPEIIKDKSTIYDLSKITFENFNQIFNEATEDVSNCETIENTRETTKSDKVNEIEFTFDVDCGRRGLHRDNTVKINNRGLVQVYLCELLEGGGIEGIIKEKVLEILSK